MLNPNDEFIIDAVAHAYNLHPSNYADVASAEPISELTYQIGGVGSPDPRYDLPHDVYVDDWKAEDVANVLFKETAKTSRSPTRCRSIASRTDLLAREIHRVCHSLAKPVSRVRGRGHVAR